MTPDRTRRRLGALLSAVLAAVLLAGCASIPTAGRVRQGGDDVAPGGDIGLIAQGPVPGADPGGIVNGFLLATQAGPTSSTSFSVAREYLTADAGKAWQQNSRVVVLDGMKVTAATIPDGTEKTTVTVTGSVVASVDDRGVYTEEPAPAAGDTSFTTSFVLSKQDGQWRISALDDGLLMPAQLFTSTYHRTTLYFAPQDSRANMWLPDVRWFPQQTWRTNAVTELLAGPPDWMGGAARALMPAGTTLSINAVTTQNGSFQVPLTGQVAEASGPDRALFQAQLEATLADGTGVDATVTLLDHNNSPIVPPSNVTIPDRPHTDGAALAIADGKPYTVSGRQLTAADDLHLHLEGLTPTALAQGPNAGPVVVRQGTDQIVRVSGDQVRILQGQDLLAPSVDRFGTVWSGSAGGPLVVVAPGGHPVTVAAPWLDGRTVVSISVSPDAGRLAVVSTGVGGPSVQVAGIVRDAKDLPVALAAKPVTVGASVAGVVQAVWEDETVLALLGQDDSGARAVYLSGVGGLPSAGGRSRRVSGLADPQAITASVGSGDMLAVDGNGVLYLHQSSAVWPAVGSKVTVVAYPG
ncbi:MAG: LpqB family beta-propeller domain-containing protein [Promicromonosporaceae bacterium]|nr:LpqB family beta-propeller domain-containing protein [Promicromonosporaceae bacterium]